MSSLPMRLAMRARALIPRYSIVRHVFNAPPSTPPSSGSGSRLSLTSVQRPVVQRKESAVPSSPMDRIMGFGGLALNLGMNTLKEAVTQRFMGSSTPTVKGGQTLQQQQAAATSVFLSEGNAEILADALCRMRGAALKLGQMISLQDESMLPPAWAKILARVRNAADWMPPWQMEKMLVSELGPNWKDLFAHFDVTPIAAASIGQVHRAVLKDGREVAVKIQYPNVANSIDSDLKNLARTLTTLRILPTGTSNMDVNKMMNIVRRELLAECDYTKEAANQREFKQRMNTSRLAAHFRVGDVIPELSTRQIITTSFLAGVPVDKVVSSSQEVGYNMLALFLEELMDWKYMQTDPNWANYLYDEKTNTIGCIDFGACHHFPAAFVDDFTRILHAAAEKRKPDIISASIRLGFLTGAEAKVMLDGFATVTEIMTEPFAKTTTPRINKSHARDGETTGTTTTTTTTMEPVAQVYDFAQHNMMKRMHPVGETMRKHQLTQPPEEMFSLQRRLTGTFMLCSKLGCKIDSPHLLSDMLSRYQFPYRVTNTVCSLVKKNHFSQLRNIYL